MLPTVEGIGMNTTTDYLTFKDRLRNLSVRFGIKRYSHRVTPGLYLLNSPTANDPVFVSANYRLSFDILRKSLHGISCFILVLDTRGINVWCAAGKGTFGTEEIINRVKETGLADHVNHKRLILPQLGAPGVEAHTVRRRTSFSVVYGPVEAADIPEYLKNNMQKTPAMRTKSFGIRDRIVLTPVELVQSWRLFLPVAAAGILFILLSSGFTSSTAADLLKSAVLPAAAGVIAGAFLSPLLLPWLPGRAFALKGAFTGAVLSVLWIILVKPGLPLIIFNSGLITASSSFISMNFTGSSTYTSLSGVKKEMRIAVPSQIAVAFLSVAGGIISAVLIGGVL